MSDAPASSQLSGLTSIIPDPNPGGRFSLHGLGTLLLPQASKPGFKHRNRNTALIAPSTPTSEHHSMGTSESEWEDLGDTRHALGEAKLDEAKSKARLAAWTSLTSGVTAHATPGDISALSIPKQGNARDGPRGLPAEPSPLVLSRTESISTTSLSIDLDALPSVTSHLHGHFALVAGQSSTSVWEETRLGAMRSSTDLIHGSLETTNALAGLIDILGLDSNGVEGQGLSSKPPGEGKRTLDVPLPCPKEDKSLDSERPVYPPTELLHPSLPTAPNGAALSASHPSTLDPPEPTIFSRRKGSSPSFHPILDTEVKKLSAPVPKSAPPHAHHSRDRQVSKPPGFRDNRKSFLPDMSGASMRTKVAPTKDKRPSTAPQLSTSYVDHQPPTLDSLLPGKKGRGQTGSVFPKFLSRAAKPLAPHWPPVPPSQPQLPSQSTMARAPPTRPNKSKASRFEH